MTTPALLAPALNAFRSAAGPSLLACSVSLGGLFQNWYVDASAPDCGSANGSVSRPFCDISSAMGAASSGDTIFVAPGVYLESLVLSEDLTLVGTAGRELTIVDATGESKRVVHQNNASTCELRGLTLTGGAPTAPVGGGIYVAADPTPSTLTLIRCAVTGNVATTIPFLTEDALGGGIFNTNGVLTLIETTVSGNSADSGNAGGGASALGGGIHNVAGTLTLVNSTVSGNRVSGTYYTGFGRGGGISSFGGAVTLDDSTVSSNIAASGYYGATARGGGIYVRGGSLSVLDSVIAKNRTSNRNFFGCEGGAIANYGATVTLSRSSLVDNRVGFGEFPQANPLQASAICNLSTGAMTIDGCTVVRGVDAYYGTAVVFSDRNATLSVTNSILWDEREEVPGLGKRNNQIPTADVRYSDVHLGWSGPGVAVLQQDPAFADPANGDYALKSTSPCVDTGDPLAAPTGVDLAGNPRLLDGDLDRSMRVDMGAFEFDHVRLTVSGNPVPGGTLTVTSTGTAGLQLFLGVGFATAQTLVAPFGTAFFGLGAPSRIFAFGVIPSAANLTIPAQIAGPLDVVLQELALGAPLANGRRPGNLSNPIFLRIE